MTRRLAKSFENVDVIAMPSRLQRLHILEATSSLIEGLCVTWCQHLVDEQLLGAVRDIVFNDPWRVPRCL